MQSLLLRLYLYIAIIFGDRTRIGAEIASDGHFVDRECGKRQRLAAFRSENGGILVALKENRGEGR